ncbi:hypothetical protein D3C72_2422120 [compost metagenome]
MGEAYMPIGCAALKFHTSSTCCISSPARVKSRRRYTASIGCASLASVSIVKGTGTDTTR